MFLPSKNQYIQFAENAGLIPVFKEIVADLDTPLTLFAKVEEAFEHTFLFESMEGGENGDDIPLSALILLSALTPQVTGFLLSHIMVNKKKKNCREIPCGF